VPKVVNAPAIGDRRPTERALERGGVQLVARLSHAQQVVLLPALAKLANDRQHAGTLRDGNFLHMSALHDAEALQKQLAS
jgi:hypothetical protein